MDNYTIYDACPHCDKNTLHDVRPYVDEEGYVHEESTCGDCGFTRDEVVG